VADFPEGSHLIVDGVAQDDSLNLRAEPGVGAKIDRKLALGTTGLVATGKVVRRGTDRWIEVKHQGQTGWLNARYVRTVQPLPAVPVPTRIPPHSSAPTERGSGKRIALVIGNARYARTPSLRNPPNDARAIADALKRVGFERVTLHIDLPKKQLWSAIDTFAGIASDAQLALIYFAGHGLQIDGSSYLLPTDAKLENADDVTSQAIELGALLRRLDSTGNLKLVVVDACRDNPFRDKLMKAEESRSRSLGYISKSIGRGLSRVEGTGHNTLVAYAARDGSLAFDGQGPNSPFAAAILKQLDLPGTELGLLFRRVRDDVLVATAKQQEPFTYGSIGGEEVYLWPVDGGLWLRDSEVSSLRKATDGIVSAFKNVDLRALATYVHPVSGIDVDGVKLTRKDLLDPDFGNKIFKWSGELLHEGYADETPVESVRAYIKRALYRRDYLEKSEVSFGEGLVGPGGSLKRGFAGPGSVGRIFHGRPGSVFVDYFVPPGPVGSNQELDWNTLRLVFEKMNDRWFLVDVAVMGWVP
jgi:hypothetical protein